MESIKQKALERIAFVFQKPVKEINDTMRFDRELRPKVCSDWVDNEHDQLWYDIEEMYYYVGENNFPAHGISTVNEYCKLVEMYYIRNQKKCLAMLQSWEKEAGMEHATKLRRIFFKLFGL
jgi:hypothetical protein